MTRNSLRVYASNFLLVWKQLLFMLVFLGIITALVFALALPIVDVIKDAGFFENVKGVMESIYSSPKNIADNVTNVVAQLWFILKDSASLVWGSYLGIILLLFVITSFGFKISQFTISALIFDHSQSLTRIAYAGKMVSSLKRASIFAVVSMIVNLPFFILVLAVGYLYGILVNNLLSATLLLPLLVIFILGILGTKNALLSGFLPQMVTTDKKVFACLKDGVKVMNGHWGMVFSTSLLMSLIVFGGSVAISLTTLGAGLLVALPSITVAKCSFWMVAHFTVTKQRYYINELTIVNPL